MIRRLFLLFVLGVLVINLIISLYFPPIWWTMIFWGPLILIGFLDMLQDKQTIRKNFPIIGNFRYLMEAIRPEINQYFVESNSSGVPFSREERSVVYQRAKNVRDTLPFGTQKMVYTVGYEWVNHSMAPKQVDPKTMRVIIGGPQCAKPYDSSLLNVGALSYGALSGNAILALNEGAKIGSFAHNTGEGGISPYHLKPGGDLIWQIGTGYFGCRTKDGKFSEHQYKDNAQIPQVKMIELKISQGAKPGGGGLLPGAKVTKEIAKIRGLTPGVTVSSPASHATFTTPTGLLEFLAQLRHLSGGKPVGFKMCIGKRREFISICKAMIKTDIYPDFITIDGSEGGTGAAPLEFSNYLGCPLTEALIFVRNALMGFDMTDKIKILASGKVTSGFGMIHRMAIGADAIYSARGMMLALGCIQALKCNANTCPTGIATQDPGLVVGLAVGDKKDRVVNFHRNTIKSLSQLIGAMGLTYTSELRPWHILRRIDTTRIQHYGEIYRFIEKGSLLNEPYPEHYERAMKIATAETFVHTGGDE